MYITQGHDCNSVCKESIIVTLDYVYTQEYLSKFGFNFDAQI